MRTDQELMASLLGKVPEPARESGAVTVVCGQKFGQARWRDVMVCDRRWRKGHALMTDQGHTAVLLEDPTPVHEIFTAPVLVTIDEAR